MTSTNTLLVLTVGQTDVQVVIDGLRRELRKDRCASLHDQIERRQWRVVDAPDSKAEPPIDTLPTGELHLCTPKLDAVLREVQPTAALVLETQRDPEAAPGDPRFAGAVVEGRLKQKGVRRICRSAYLEDSERLENREEPRDAIIRRAVVQRLEDAVRRAIKEVNPSDVVVALTGGFPVVSDLVEEIVRLHACVPVKAFEVADGAQANPPMTDRAVPRTTVPEPRISFQARRRVLDLISKGNLLGAWAVAEPLHSDEVESRWTQVIEWLACFASSLPLPDDCNIDILKDKRMAVWAGMRVELALRAGDIPRAVHGTVAFFEAALWDHLTPCIAERAKDDKGRTIVQLKEAPPEGLKGAPDGVNAFKRAQAPAGKDGNWYYVEDTGPAVLKLINEYLKKSQLAALYDATESIRDLRNDVAHNEPTPELMRDARRRMTDAGLWSEGGGFLTQKIIQDVLSELGVSEPENMCDNLIATVRSRLLEQRADKTSST
ncbi:MAG TPA: hypothetical protein VNL72_03510 [Gammaproteobacteria bacterium]|nr:hypothetical protein [Gammaproteobacteria bacterium]